MITQFGGSVYFLIVLEWSQAVRVEAAATSLRDRLIIRLCLYMGLRAHEVADARIEHIDVDGWLYIPHGHNSGARYVSVDSKTLRLLAEYVGDRVQGPLLTKENSLNPISRWVVYYAIRKAGEKSGVVKPKPVGPLMLRHTFATTWLRKGGNIRWLQKQLGHANLESTAYYLDWLPGEVKAEHERLFGHV